jgi:hypothetical protein
MKTVVADRDAGEWRIIIRSKEDDARLIHMHVFLFNLYFDGLAKLRRDK